MRFTGLRAWEILVVLAIVAVGALSSLPHYCTGKRESRHLDCRNNLRQIGVYFAIYDSRYHSYPAPGTITWFSSLWRSDLAQDGKIFRCPVRGREGTGTHYQGLTEPREWQSPVPGSRRYRVPAAGPDIVSAPDDLPLACDETWPTRNHGPNGGINVLRFDGRVEEAAYGSELLHAVDAFLGPETGWAAPAQLP